MSSAIMSKRSPARFIIHFVFIVFSLLCIFPMISIASISLSSESDIALNGYRILPFYFDSATKAFVSTFDTVGYQYVLNDPSQIVNAYVISLSVTFLGGLLSLAVTAGIAYALSRYDFKLRNALSFYVFFTMLFNGGLLPWYMLITNFLHLKNNFWVLILPYLVVPWYTLMLRTFMQKIPMEIIESCQIDGASEFRIFAQMIVPLSKPGLATVGLLILLRYWNDWWLSMLYIEREALVPLQYMLYRMMANIQFLTTSNSLPPMLQNVKLPAESARMAMALLAAGPMLMVFPFFQKYFVKGLTVGAVKG